MAVYPNYGGLWHSGENSILLQRIGRENIMHTIRKKRILILVSWSIVVIWMAVIFLFSAQPAYESDSISQSVTLFVLNLAERVVPSLEPAINVTTLNYLVRKVAHFVIYLVLGVLTINALKMSGITTFKATVWTLLICIVYAASDETHQMFVPGRSAQVRDVLIDSIGAAIGVCGYYVIMRTLKERCFI